MGGRLEFFASSGGGDMYYDKSSVKKVNKILVVYGLKKYIMKKEIRGIFTSPKDRQSTRKYLHTKSRIDIIRD